MLAILKLCYPLKEWLQTMGEIKKNIMGQLMTIPDENFVNCFSENDTGVNVQYLMP